MTEYTIGMSKLKGVERLIVFDEQFFVRTVEQSTAFPDRLIFAFMDGTENSVEE